MACYLEHVFNFQCNLFNREDNILMGEGNGTPLQYSCLENSMDGGAWWATVHGLTPLSSNSASLHDRLDGELEGMCRGEF